MSPTFGCNDKGIRKLGFVENFHQTWMGYVQGRTIGFYGGGGQNIKLRAKREKTVAPPVNNLPPSLVWGQRGQTFVTFIYHDLVI